ncbi:MAG: hypothetical protein ACRCTY_03995, partial [Candidatus Adiutrix sp.]
NQATPQRPDEKQGGEAGFNEQNIRSRYGSGRPAPSARRMANSQLPLEEQVGKVAQIKKSAVEYEAMLMDSMVKNMRQSPLAEMTGGDTFQSIAEMPFRDFLSQSGGLGLADQIVNQVARQEGLERILQDFPEVMGPTYRPVVPQNLMKKPAGNLQMHPEHTLKQVDNEILDLDKAGEMKLNINETLTLNGEKPAQVGLLTNEEIAYLHQDASFGLA